MSWKLNIWDALPEIAGGIILIGFTWGFGYLISHHQNAIEKRYGFCTMTPEMKWIPCHIEPLMIRCVTRDGAFGKAGFEDRDIIVLHGIHSVSAFHRLLRRPGGTIIELYAIPFKKFNSDCDQANWGTPVKRFVIAP